MSHPSCKCHVVHIISGQFSFQLVIIISSTLSPQMVLNATLCLSQLFEALKSVLLSDFTNDCALSCNISSKTMMFSAHTPLNHCDVAEFTSLISPRGKYKNVLFFSKASINSCFCFKI